MSTHYEHGPGCTLGANGQQCEACARQYPTPPRGRRCAHCGKLGGSSHAVQVSGQMRAFYLHRGCLRPFIAAKGDR